MKSYLFFILIFAFSSSCGKKDNKNVTISILNNTAYRIDSFRIDSYEVSTAGNEILSGKKVERTLRMTYSANYEGAFRLHVFSGTDTVYGFGYFANAGDIKSGYNVELYNNFSLKQYE